jgi:uncharacterized membrane protein YccC
MNVDIITTIIGIIVAIGTYLATIPAGDYTNPLSILLGLGIAVFGYFTNKKTKTATTPTTGV